MNKDDIYNQALLSCPAKALANQVVPEVHPKDFIFRFVIENPVFQNLDSAVGYYFNNGAESAAKLRELLHRVCGWKGEPFNLLEFASGYGCVTRHFHNVVPEATVTGCDIHPEAVEFLSSRFGVETALSDPIPEKLSVDKDYDIVFALSFFSHMPRATWTRWFDALLSKVKDGGYVVFTTQGLVSRQYFGFPQFDEDGFWFRPDSEQKDLGTSEYGSTVVHPMFVFQEALKNSSGRIVCFHEGY